MDLKSVATDLGLPATTCGCRWHAHCASHIANLEGAHGVDNSDATPYVNTAICRRLQRLRPRYRTWQDTLKIVWLQRGSSSCLFDNSLQFSGGIRFVYAT